MFFEMEKLIRLLRGIKHVDLPIPLKIHQVGLGRDDPFSAPSRIPRDLEERKYTGVFSGLISPKKFTHKEDLEAIANKLGFMQTEQSSNSVGFIPHANGPFSVRFSRIDNAGPFDSFTISVRDPLEDRHRTGIYNFFTAIRDLDPSIGRKKAQKEEKRKRRKW